MNVLGDEQFGRYNSTILPVLLMLVAISILYPIYLIYFGIKEKKSGSWIILIGYFVFAMAVTNDMLNYLRVLNSVTFVEAGFLAFITSISFSLAVKFAEVHNQLEYLTKNLSDEVGIEPRNCLKPMQD
jgi:hypothetical protein